MNRKHSVPIYTDAHLILHLNGGQADRVVSGADDGVQDSNTGFGWQVISQRISTLLGRSHHLPLRVLVSLQNPKNRQLCVILESTRLIFKNFSKYP